MVIKSDKYKVSSDWGKFCPECSNSKLILNLKNGSLKCSKCKAFVNESYFTVMKRNKKNSEEKAYA